jgi:hypothetical protein
MSEISKKRQSYFDDLKKYLSQGDEDAVADLMRTKDPLAIRNDMSTALGQHVKQNYDAPENIFEKSKLIKDVPIEYTKLPDGIAGRYSPDTNGIYLNHPNPDLENRQAGILAHEQGHANDRLKGFKNSQPLNEIEGTLKGEGLENAIKAIGQHHEGGFFEKEALMKLLQGKKLGALLPIVGGLGIGASVLGIGNKAMAGDLGNAALDTASLAADMTPLLGEAKMAVTPSELGNAEIMPEDQKKFWELKQKLKP